MPCFDNVQEFDLVIYAFLLASAMADLVGQKPELQRCALLGYEPLFCLAGTIDTAIATIHNGRYPNNTF